MNVLTKERCNALSTHAGRTAVVRAVTNSDRCPLAQLSHPAPQQVPISHPGKLFGPRQRVVASRASLPPRVTNLDLLDNVEGPSSRVDARLNAGAGASASLADCEARQLPTATPLLGRRAVLLRSTALPVLGSLTIGSDDPTTLLNSVLAGYGLPKLPGSTGFKLLDDFELEFTLEYPRSWVVRPNMLRQGVYISDFNTADKLSVEVFPLPSGEDLATAAVKAAVVPGAGTGQQDDKLLLPPASRIKSRSETMDGKEYTYLEFPSETITRSGYQVRRKNFAVAAVKRGTVYTLNASSRTDQLNKDKEALLRHVVASFRVR